MLEKKEDDKTKLTSDNVQAVFVACLSPEYMPTLDVKVEGIINTFCFTKDTLEGHRDDIGDMLDQLPEQFHQGQGDGWTFLNACVDRDGNLWTGLNLQMEKLFCLGMGIDRVKILLPRDFWCALPGGMPYVMVTRAPQGGPQGTEAAG